MSLLGADLRDEIKGKKKKDETSDGLYRGGRSSVTLKETDQQQPIEVTVYTDAKNKVIGVELNGFILPMTVHKATNEKVAEINRIYRLGRQAIIQAIRLLIPRG